MSTIGILNIPDGLIPDAGGGSTPGGGGSGVDAAYVNMAVATAIDRLVPKRSVKVMSASNVTISGIPADIDGVTDLVDGDRILLNGQQNKVENGIWLIRENAWERPPDFAEGEHADSSFVFIEKGTLRGEQGWSCTTDDPDDIIGSNNLIWKKFTELLPHYNFSGYPFTISADDVTNKYITLPQAPYSASGVQMIIATGGEMMYGLDFQMDESVPERVTWAGMSLDGILATGDKGIIHYHH